MRSPPRATALLAAAAALAAPLLSACVGGDRAAEPFTMITVEEAERLLREPDVVVIDANSRGTYERSRLPGAIHYRAAPFAELLPADRERRLVFYCASPS